MLQSTHSFPGCNWWYMLHYKEHFLQLNMENDKKTAFDATLNVTSQESPRSTEGSSRKEYNTRFPKGPVLYQISSSFFFNSSYLWLLSGDSYTSSRLIPNSRFCFHRFHSLFEKCSQGRLGNQIRVSNHWG